MSLQPWRDLSLVLLALEAFLLSLVPLAMFYYCVKGMRWLLPHMREWFARLRSLAEQANRFVATACKKIVTPFVAWQSVLAGAKALLRKCFGIVA